MNDAEIHAKAILAAALIQSRAIDPRQHTDDHLRSGHRRAGIAC